MIARQLGIFFQSTSTPSFQIDTNFLGIGIERTHDKMSVVGPAVHREERPAAMATGLLGLGRDKETLSWREQALLFAHFRLAVSLQIEAWKLPAMVILDPASLITWKPCAISSASQKESDWILYGNIACCVRHRQ